MSRKRKSLRLPNKFGGIVNLGSRRRKPYAARITIGWSEDRKQIYKYLGYFETREDALACLSEFYKSPYNESDRRTTFKELYEEWIETHEVTRDTINIYNSTFRKLESIHNMPIIDLRASHIQPIIKKSPYSTAKLMRLITGIVCREAMKREITNRDISTLLDLPPKKEKKEKMPFTKEEIDLLWSKVGEKYADLLLILLYSGLRISELLEIKSSNIDLENRFMIGGLKTEAGTNRTIPIHKLIHPIIERVKGENYLFQAPRGSHLLYSNEGYKINKYMKSLGLKHTIHETRHTFISQCNRLDINKISVKRIVGHSTQKDLTDDVYTHKNIDDLIQAIDSFKY